jgi:hypothetical protein
MPLFDPVAAAATAHEITGQQKTINQLRSDRMSTRLFEMAMQGHSSPRERMAHAEKVRACDDLIESAVIGLGSLEVAMAEHLANAKADMKTASAVDAAVAKARLQPVAAKPFAAKPSRVSGAPASGLAAIYATLDPNWNDG